MKHFAVAALAIVASAASAQEFRGTLTGRVTDPTGAVIPKAKITITNTDTGVKVLTVSNRSGEYTAPFLLPGKYSVQAIAPGFSTYLHDNITVLTSEKVEEDVQLAVGSEAQEVHVSSDNTLIETSTATMGQVLTAEEIEDLPDNGRSPLGLAKTEEGVVPKAKNSVVQTRPFDNSATSDFSIGGGNSQSNEYLLNGVPNNQDSSRVPGFSPNLDSVASIRVDVFESDASYGDTSGGTVNLVTKAGTNSYHGTVSEFNQFSAINAPQRWFVPPGTVTPATRQNQYGATFGGPVRIPGLFNGRDKLFFFYAFEKFVDTVPNAVLNSVPTVAERNGDFSALLALGSQYQLYDPLTGTLSTSSKGVVSVSRSPLAGNIIPTARINPVAKAYLQYFPLPNVTGSADGQNNYFSNVPTRDDYNSHSGRMDYSINDSNKLFFEIHRSEYYRLLSNIFNNISTGTSTYNVYQGGQLDYIHTFAPTVTLDTRLSLTRAYSNTTLPSQGFDATSLGFPAYINTNATEQVMPRISFSDTSGTKAFAGLSTTAGTLSAFDTYQLFSALTKVSGHHTLKIGPDLRLEKYAKLTPGTPSGSFTFGTSFVNGGSAQTVTNPFGASFADFLFGFPTSETQTIATPALYNAGYFAGFLQDDWRVLPHLTLNLGLRLEHETPIYESHNYAVAGFDPNATNSVTAAAEAKYAANYTGTTATALANMPAANFKPTGGIYYATPDHRNEYNTAPAYVSPRFGFAFAPPVFHDKLVIRGGYGIFVNPFNDYNTPQSYGYSATTTYTPATTVQLPTISLSDPFNATTAPILQPTGSSLGVNTNLGAGVQFRGPNLKVPYAERYNLDIQRSIGSHIMFDIGYLGAHQVHLSYSNAVSSIPLLPYLSRSFRADPAVSSALGASVPNPFYGLPNETGTLGTNTTTTVYQLMQSNPEYSGVTQALVPGASATFNQLMARFYIRNAYGMTLNANYEYSKNLITGQLTPGGPLTYGESTSDYPHHVSVTGTYALPIGHGKKFLNHAGVVDALIGGFQVNTIYQMLSGTPIQWGLVDFANGTARFQSDFQKNPRNIERAFNTDVFYKGTGQGYKSCTTPIAGVPCDPTDTGQASSTYNYRQFPQYFLRSDFTNNLDASVIKAFRVGERYRIEYRFEAFNVLNHTQFGSPNVTPTSAISQTSAGPSGFGTINTISSVNRTLQQGLRIQF